MRLLQLGGLALLRLATADVTAPAKTMKEMVERIQSGKCQNSFYHANSLKIKCRDDSEAVAGCLLDKVSAILEEDGAAEFRDELLVDLAACCTKSDDAAKCISELEQPYTLLQEAVGDDIPTKAAVAAGWILKAAQGRIDEARVKASYVAYMKRCPDDPKDATMDQLKGIETGKPRRKPAHSMVRRRGLSATARAMQEAEAEAEASAGSGRVKRKAAIVARTALKKKLSEGFEGSLSSDDEAFKSQEEKEEASADDDVSSNDPEKAEIVPEKDAEVAIGHPPVAAGLIGFVTGGGVASVVLLYHRGSSAVGNVPLLTC
eukprot:gnl/TRDRNA2_/TRDRNA2_189337_c0_seq1.p1 gnl/TRDRNA2_/TRDRNA2_189337_c0~~gnl/TRDRNA2_/TRDRNA2_189337_c0_seq1.p1  ORF type:complete len:318 (-),score=80.68 gnl/TRDRNA2_/TRDRNA2_189337_c0_seq1:60-1013(-)